MLAAKVTVTYEGKREYILRNQIHKPKRWKPSYGTHEIDINKKEMKNESRIIGLHKCWLKVFNSKETRYFKTFFYWSIKKVVNHAWWHCTNTSWINDQTKSKKVFHWLKHHWFMKFVAPRWNNSASGQDLLMEKKLLTVVYRKWWVIIKKADIE